MNRGRSKHRPRNDKKLYGGKYPFIQTGDVAKAGLFLESYQQTYSEYGIQQSKLWNKGTLLITIAANIADTCILNIKAAFPDSIIGFESEEIDMVFMKHIIDNASNDLKNRAETSSQANLNLAKLSNLKVSIPSREEQNQLGSFLKQLDETITLHQRKLNALNQIKQGYLQQMFPKKNKKSPDLRFANYGIEWKQHKLIEIADMFNNLRIPVTASDRIKGETPYYGANGIQDYVSGFTHEGEFVLIAEDGANDLINYPVQYIKGKVWVNNHAHVVSGKSTYLDNLFLTARMKAMNISSMLVGGGRAKLNGEVLKKILIKAPIYEEQIKIGACFKQLDNLITLHQQKLDKLIKTKKALLQKMFI